MDAAREPLLPKAGKDARKKEGLFDEGSVGSSVIILTASAMGTGVLTLPYAVRSVGIIPAVLLFAVAGLAARASSLVLFECVRKTGCGSYGDLMTSILGGKAVAVLNFFVCVEGLGTVAAYLIFIMDYVPQVCAFLQPGCWCTDRTNVVMAACAIIWPLTCLKGLSAFRYTSTLSIFNILFTCVVVILKAPGLFAKHRRPFLDVVYEVNLSYSAFQVISIASFAFMTHTASPEIARCFTGGKKAAAKVIGVHTALLWSIYCLIAISGFLAFLEDTHQDFLTNYDVDDILVVACRSLLSATLVIASPINLFPAVQALFSLLEGVAGQARGTFYDQDSIRVPVTTCLFAMAAGVAMKTPHVADLVGSLGAYLASPLMFAFPALMHWRILGRQDSGLPCALLLLTAVLYLGELRWIFGIP